MQPQEAAQALHELERLRRVTRGTLRALWFPLVLFGSLSLVSAPVAAVAGGPALAAYWVVAGPAGGVLTAWYYRRRERRRGLERPAAPYVLTGVGIVGGSALAGAVGGALGSDLTASVGPIFVVALGYVVFAWLDRSIALAALGAGLALGASALAAAGVGAEATATVVALGFGAASVATGLAYRRGERWWP